MLPDPETPNAHEHPGELPELPEDLLRQSPRDAVPCLLAAILAALFGGIAAAIFMPTWQIAVESAQVLAGIVQYPPENPFYQYHIKTWTFAHQIPAILLALGATEYTLSWVISILLGALTFSAIALCTCTLSRNLPLAIVAPLYLFALYGGTNIHGVVYPLYLMGTHHTYGVLGLGISLLTITLWANQSRKTAAILIGIAPAVHLAWGCWTILVIALATLWERRNLPPAPKPKTPTWPWLALAAAITATSLVWQWNRARQLPHVPNETVQPLQQAFLDHWDGHRGIIPLIQPGIALTAALALICAVCVFRSRIELDTAAARLLRLLLISTILALAAIAATHLPMPIPRPIQAAMPGRFANLSILALPPVLLGLLGLMDRTTSGRLLLALSLLYPLANWFFILVLSSERFGWRLHHWATLAALALIIAGVALIRPHAKLPLRKWWNPLPAALAAALIIGIFAFRLVNPGTGHALNPLQDTVYTANLEPHALIIAPAGAELTQLRARRPILLNTGGLDQLIYVPQSAPAINQILTQIYGIHLQDPPEDIRQRRPGALLPYSERNIWAARTTQDWRQIRQTFNTTYVLSRAEIPLELPLVTRDSTLTLYRIPQP